MTETIQRKIIHVDMDAFYASVEQRDRVELRGKPLIVGGQAERRGVVASCSYEARKYGIRSAMSTRMALERCPRAIVVPPDMAKYREASRKIREIFYEVTDLVEPLSLDEAYLDVTQNKKGEAFASTLAKWIRAEIKSRLQLTASAGVGPNKFIAKLASDMKKPNALVVIPPEKVAEVMKDLPVERLWGVGPATAKKLHEAKLFTANDIRNFSAFELEKIVGKCGAFLFRLAHGEDDRAVDTEQVPKSRGSETTFDEDTKNLTQLENTIKELALDIQNSLKKYNLQGTTITLKLKYFDFKTITRSQTLPKASDDPQILSQVAIELLKTKTEAGKTAVRLVGLSLSGFGNQSPMGDPLQLNLDHFIS